jgi:hypothetical protein
VYNKARRFYSGNSPSKPLYSTLHLFCKLYPNKLLVYSSFSTVSPLSTHSFFSLNTSNASSMDENWPPIGKVVRLCIASHTLQMKGQWESNINVCYDLCIPRNETAWPCHFQNRIIMFLLSVSAFMCLLRIYAMQTHVSCKVHQKSGCDTGLSFFYLSLVLAPWGARKGRGVKGRGWVGGEGRGWGEDASVMRWGVNWLVTWLVLLWEQGQPERRLELTRSLISHN